MELLFLIYHDDIVDVGFYWQIDNNINLVVNESLGFTLTINDNANYFPVSLY